MWHTSVMLGGVTLFSPGVKYNGSHFNMQIINYKRFLIYLPYSVRESQYAGYVVYVYFTVAVKS